MLIDSASLDAYLEFARTICMEAGEVLVDARRQRRLSVSTKSAFELVTDADWAVDQHIRQRIATAFGGHAVLSEEGDDPVASADVPCWIIDPLDGTANFVNGHDHVAVSAALAINNRVILGVVHAPFHQQTFWAVEGQGAFRDGSPIRTSPINDARRALIGTGFPHERAEIEALVDRLKLLLREFGDIRRLAAPALDICWVADGRLAGFVDRLYWWDVAAAGLIATEAGARLRRLGSPQGQTGSRAEADYLIAAPGIYERLSAVMYGT